MKQNLGISHSVRRGMGVSSTELAEWETSNVEYASVNTGIEYAWIA